MFKENDTSRQVVDDDEDFSALEEMRSNLNIPNKIQICYHHPKVFEVVVDEMV